MQYFILPILFLIFCDFFGKSITVKLNLKSNFMFDWLIGFTCILSIVYIVGFPLVIVNANFKILFILVSLIFLGCLALIAVERKKILKLYNKSYIYIYI